eukprot:CAMPEP_0183487274 /NCGR_PEP_ID=MMETSP0370-20130417/180354_1 /TAXON_ID=268820 /ORGANISM="Peridinium aciculiferum, Strain PAER-2" /LENGTH=354 /DNA_ID=CAMNT_0025680595 /DNA_START=27 /DNA_END=1093 /DNA_ORIENTATION=+
MNKTEDKGRGRGGGSEKLIIFGPTRGRRGAELKVMSGVETKTPGFFTKGVREKTSDERGFDTDRLILQDDELSYSLGKQGTTRKKLEGAAGAILAYVATLPSSRATGSSAGGARSSSSGFWRSAEAVSAFIAGDRKQRRRCQEFLKWLLAQRRGSVTVTNVSEREDATEMHVPENCKGWVTGNRGSELRRMEAETGTYMFLALDERGDERLIIFCHDAGSKVSPHGRMAAERLVNEMIQEKLRDDGGRGGGKEAAHRPGEEAARTVAVAPRAAAAARPAAAATTPGAGRAAAAESPRARVAMANIHCNQCLVGVPAKRPLGQSQSLPEPPPPLAQPPPKQVGPSLSDLPGCGHP